MRRNVLALIIAATCTLAAVSVLDDVLAAADRWVMSLRSGR